jgi:hypothetical protein
MTTNPLIDRLMAARRAAAPLLAISTPDPAEVVRLVQAAFDGETSKTPIPLVQWDSMNGLTSLNKAGMAAIAALLKGAPVAKWPALTTNPNAAIAMMADLPGELREGGQLTQRGAIVFMCNAQRFVEDRPDTRPAQVLQGIWNLRDLYKANRRTLIMLGPAFKFPSEIAQDVITFDEPYPTDEVLAKIITDQAATVKLMLKPEQVASAVDALRGLAAFTAEQLVAMSLMAEGVDLAGLWEQKIRVVEQTDGLLVDRGSETFDDVRGLDNFREFGTGLINSPRCPTLYVRIDEINTFFGGLGTNGGPADNTNISQDRLGVLLRVMEDEGYTGFIGVGHAGTGKTLITKSLANTATKVTGRRTLSISLDLGAMGTGMASSAERAIRAAMKMIKSLAAGGRVCFVGTCNDLSVLPPALKRRFKLGTWMFDLPSPAARKQQWELNMAKFGLKKQAMPDDTDWTGSDIRNVCDTADQLNVPLIKACQFTTFVAKSDPEAITRLRQLADGKFVDAEKPGVYKAPFTDTPFGAPAQRTARRAAGSEE